MIRARILQMIRARILWLTFAALVTLAYGFKGALAALAIAGAWHLYHARKATP